VLAEEAAVPMDRDVHTPYHGDIPESA
jgi:hypothetical protein